jgi:hypothetical protein
MSMVKVKGLHRIRVQDKKGNVSDALRLSTECVVAKSAPRNDALRNIYLDSLKLTPLPEHLLIIWCITIKAHFFPINPLTDLKT